MYSANQALLFNDSESYRYEKFSTQLLKWVGNKQRFAHEIASCFPERFGTYIEPFLGSGAVLGTIAPDKAIASDIFAPLMEIWSMLHDDVDQLIDWYTEQWDLTQELGKKEGYEKIKASYNETPNGKDLLFLCRACYGGVVRFRKSDGYMSTPCGIHNPVKPHSFEKRAKLWKERTKGSIFRLAEYRESMNLAQKGDLIYCDPPYSHTQSILYGGQSFVFNDLLDQIAQCKSRGVYVALSIDGTKKSGNVICNLPIPKGLFEREIFVNCGRSMLRRFQMGGETLESELVTDRLLLTY